MVLTEAGACSSDRKEFTVNHSLLAEMLDGDDDDLRDRLADLSDIVPDFPIDEKEVGILGRSRDRARGACEL